MMFLCTQKHSVACIKRKLNTVSAVNMQYKKKIKLLQQSNRRLKKRVTGLKDIISALQKNTERKRIFLCLKVCQE